MIGGFVGLGVGVPLNAAEREGWHLSPGAPGSADEADSTETWVDEADSTETWVEQSSTSEAWTWST